MDKADEVRFLAPLSITLLPLPRAHLQQLHWLVLGCLEPDPACPRQTNVERDKLLKAEPAELAELIDRLADQASAPPRNRC